jgi:hypothetical protein
MWFDVGLLVAIFCCESEILTGLQAVAGQKELPACDVMQRTQFVMSLEMPAAFRKHAFVRLRGHHFGQKQIIGVLDMRLWDDLAFQPGDAACYGNPPVKLA